MWKILRVNTKTGNVTEEAVKDSYKLLGGRSLIAQFMLDEVKPACDPLGPENKLLFCVGALAGTNASTAHRLSVGGKSPLTGGIKESNAGGTVARGMAGHGIKMIVFDDKPESGLKYLHIDAEGKAGLKDASKLAGLGNYALVDHFKEEYGDKLEAVASIGGSGELLYKNAGITSTEFGSMHPSRVAARGGLGSLMGSKGIKAVVIEKPASRFKPEVADQAGFDEARAAHTKAIADYPSTSAYTKMGTIVNVAATGPAGIMPYKNFSGGYMKDHAKLGPASLMANNAARGGKTGVPCQAGCPIRCSNVYNDKDGNYLTSGFEYETVGMCGSNLCISDMDTVAAIDRFCDDFGVDTIEVGTTLGVCMEGGKIAWGDAEGVKRLLKEMAGGTEFGKIMGQGTEACGKYLGVKRIPVVKHQSMAAYEPRNLKGTGVTYAVSPMGADHTAGATVGTPYPGTDRYVQLFLSRTMQIMAAAADSCLCLFGFLLAASRLDTIAKMYETLYGVPFPVDALMGSAVKTLMLERAFNKAAGLTVEDDDVPEFFKTEKSPYTGATFDFNIEEMQSVFNF